MKQIPKLARLVGALLVTVALLAASCSSSDSTEATAAQVCAPGDTKVCMGTGPCQGTQACAADGQSYDPCVCGAAGAGQGGAGAAGSGGKPSGGHGGTAAAGGMTAGSGGAGASGASGGVAGKGGGGQAGAGVSGGGQSGGGQAGAGVSGGGQSGGGQAGAGVAGNGQAGTGFGGSGLGGSTGRGGAGVAGGGQAGAGQAGNDMSGAGQGGAGMSGAGGSPPCDDQQCFTSCLATKAQGGLCLQGDCHCTTDAPKCIVLDDGGVYPCKPAACSTCCQMGYGAPDGICQADACSCLTTPLNHCDPIQCSSSCASGCGVCTQDLCACEEPSACMGQNDGGLPDADIPDGPPDNG